MNLHLDGLTSPDGLVLPKTIGDCLSLDGLTSAKGLVLPDGFPLDRLSAPKKVKRELAARLLGQN